MNDTDKTDISQTAFLDTLEKLVINAVVPLMEIVKKEVPTLAEKNAYNLAKAIVAKIGLRISLGKDIADKIILGSEDKK